jgi:NADH:flavin oxidoreductase / NADH oxidase family
MRTPQVPIGSGFDAATTAAQVIKGIDLTGKTVIVTGGYSGIGVETVRVFLMPSTNQRSDRYGGPIVQRMNFVMELVEALTQAFGRDRVGIRLYLFHTVCAATSITKCRPLCMTRRLPIFISS